MMIPNDDIRRQMKADPQLAVAMLADELGVSESTLYRKLRHRMEPHERRELLAAIDRVRFVMKCSEDELKKLNRKTGKARVREIDRMRKERK